MWRSGCMSLMMRKIAFCEQVCKEKNVSKKQNGYVSNPAEENFYQNVTQVLKLLKYPKVMKTDNP